MLNDIAYAQSAGDAAGGGGLIANLLPLIIIVVIFYFLLIRPQQKRNKEHNKMINAIAVGDEVMTSGGIFGRISKVGMNSVTMNLGNTEISIQKQSIQAILPQGSLDKM